MEAKEQPGRPSSSQGGQEAARAPDKAQEQPAKPKSTQGGPGAARTAQD